QQAVYRFCQQHPQAARRLIRWVNAKQLEGAGCDVDAHFNPRYDPWDQRLCAVPDGDLFRAIRARTASVVTGHVETFTETGVRLAGGQELDADVEVDGAPVALPDTVAYKGLMLSGVPNLVFAIGYTNASWTLKVDLVCAYF